MNIVSWSGGKDSTATLILAHQLGIKIDKAIICLLWFDKERKIYADRPEHIEWLFNKAIPTIQSWGTEVEIVYGHRDYMQEFYHVVTQSSIQSRNGKLRGFLIPGLCKMSSCKQVALQKAIRRYSDAVSFVGICANETERLARMDKRNQRSLLAENNLSTEDSYQLCKQNGLLSPNYTIIDGTKIRGCWFCPNSHIEQFVDLKLKHPALWRELEEFNTNKSEFVSEHFNRDMTFDRLNEQVDFEIKAREVFQW